jgi:hypothetical protein
VLSNIGHGSAMEDVRGEFWENRYGHLVKDGGATAPAPYAICWIFGSLPSAIDNIDFIFTEYFCRYVITWKLELLCQIH